MQVSAVILSANPVRLSLPGVTVVPYISEFSDPAGLLAARCAAIKTVTTPWFFFLDDDDELPVDYLRVLDLCVTSGKPLAYTNEKVIYRGRSLVRRSGLYCQQAHLTNITYVHHLSVCRTDCALDALNVIPRGNYGVEPLLYFEMAKSGAAWIDEIGYHWNTSGRGMSMHPLMLSAMNNSSTWAGEHQ